MAYNLHDLRVKGANFSELLGCQISGGIGAHGRLKIFGYPKSILYYAAPEAAIGQLFVQYEDTDWQFLKRLMSMFGLTITPDCRHKGIRLYAGL